MAMKLAMVAVVQTTAAVEQTTKIANSYPSKYTLLLHTLLNYNCHIITVQYTLPCSLHRYKLILLYHSNYHHVHTHIVYFQYACTIIYYIASTLLHYITFLLHINYILIVCRYHPQIPYRGNFSSGKVWRIWQIIGDFPNQSYPNQQLPLTITFRPIYLFPNLFCQNLHLLCHCHHQTFLLYSIPHMGVTFCGVQILGDIMGLLIHKDY